jgi:cytochrome c oxidase subunit 2
LAGWILDAQHVKPGALMPEMDIDSQDLQALLVYLETLK